MRDGKEQNTGVGEREKERRVVKPELGEKEQGLNERRREREKARAVKAVRQRQQESAGAGT